MTTRIGKIGRLPKSIREELGRRIEDGLPGNEIVQWLNTQPDVLAVLAQYFEGRTITEQNLSEWRQSGHLEWVRRQEAMEASDRLKEWSEDLQKGAVLQNWSDRWAMVVTVEMQRVAAALVEQEPDLAKRWERLCGISKELSALRRDDHRLGRLVLQREQWEFAEERRLKEETRLGSQEKRERLMDMILEQKNKAKNAEYFGAKEAEMYYRLKFDIPMDDIMDGRWERENVQKPTPTSREHSTSKAAGEEKRKVPTGVRAWAEKRRAEAEARGGATADGKSQMAKQKCAKRPVKTQKSKLFQANPSGEFQKAGEGKQPSNEGTKEGTELQAEKFADRKMGGADRAVVEGDANSLESFETGQTNEVAEARNAPGRETGAPAAETQEKSRPARLTEVTGTNETTDAVMGSTVEAEAMTGTTETSVVTAPALTAKQKAYNAWFRMVHYAIPFDEAELARLNVEAEKEEYEMKNAPDMTHRTIEHSTGPETGHRVNQFLCLTKQQQHPNKIRS